MKCLRMGAYRGYGNGTIKTINGRGFGRLNDSMMSTWSIMNLPTVLLVAQVWQGVFFFGKRLHGGDDTFTEP